MWATPDFPSATTAWARAGRCQGPPRSAARWPLRWPHRWPLTMAPATATKTRRTAGFVTGWARRTSLAGVAGTGGATPVSEALPRPVAAPTLGSLPLCPLRCRSTAREIPIKLSPRHHCRGSALARRRTARCDVRLRAGFMPWPISEPGPRRDARRDHRRSLFGYREREGRCYE